MHEIALVSEIISIAQAKATEFQRTKILKINLCVGILACVEENTLRSCFEVVSETTMAANANLSIEKIPANASCKTCLHFFEITKRQFKCPECKSFNIHLNGGKELYVKSIETD